jgi:probable rRNA maturation factor
MTIELELQVASTSDAVPGREAFENWLASALRDCDDVGLAIRVVDETEMQALNSRYRGQDKPTNVLSFPADLPEALRGRIEPEPLGDIVICASIVETESKAQGKPTAHHWAHLTIHGLLHLLGHDHQEKVQAQAMEALEIDCLSRLGIPDPYGR